MTRRKWTEAEINFIRSCPEFTDRQFAELYKTTPKVICALRYRHGIKKPLEHLHGGRPSKSLLSGGE